MCFGGCDDDAQCKSACDEDSAFCVSTGEICDSDADEDLDGLQDCEERDCSTKAACAEGIAAACTEATDVSEGGRFTGTTEAGEVAEGVHEEVAEKLVAQVLETVQQQVAAAVQDQGAPSAGLQEKVEQIVMEKIADAVQSKAEEVGDVDVRADEKKEVL